MILSPEISKSNSDRPCPYSGFRDMISVTDGYGRLTYRAPLAQFDLVDGYSGFAPIPINGIEIFRSGEGGPFILFYILTILLIKKGLSH